MEDGPSFTGLTRAEALRRLRAALSDSGVPSPELDARQLVAAALSLEPAALLASGGTRLGEAEAKRLAEYAGRRLLREPVGRILGHREFWSLPFRLSAETLEPRPDTETVVEAALARAPDRAARLSVADLGTGTGCLLIALLSELPAAWGIGLDRSLDALRTAQINAEANGVGRRAGFAAGNWADPLAGRFDLVVANPPYIPSGLISRLDPEVASHDPHAALDGGLDGLSAYRAILPRLPHLLTEAGFAVLEIGADQAEALRGLAAKSGISVRAIHRDLAGRERAVVLS